MKSHLSAAEIAALELPGLPRVKRAINRMAASEGWPARARSGRGGGVEYAIESLPPEARAAYVARHIASIDVPAPVARAAAAEPEAGALGGNAAQGRDARLALLAQADKLAEAASIGRKRADRQFCSEYNAGALIVAGWIRAEVKSLTPRTLMRWRALAADGHRTRLGVDRGAARKGSGVLDRANGGEIKTFILALLAKQPHLTAHHIRALVADRCPDIVTGDGELVALPPIRTFQHALKQWRTSYRVELESIRNPDGFKSRMRFAARIARPADALNEVWQIDASPADMLTTDGRYTLYVCLDIYSRRIVATVTKTPRADAVGLLIRKAILAWGVPGRIKTDNGSDFIARATQRLFAALGIEHEKSAPFSPEQKGHVERAIGTIQRGLMRTLEGFIGHSVADRKIIENRKAFSARLGEAAEDTFAVALSAADLQARVDEWCSDVYANKPHAGLSGQTPFAMAAMSPTPARRIEDVRALDMLLAPVAGKDGLRVVTKTGLRINGTHYIGGFLNVGDTVLVRMDDADMGRAYVFSADGESYLGQAISPDLAGIDPAAAIAAARNAQKSLIAERMHEVRREARRIKAKDFAPAIHRQSLLNAGKLVEFPRAVEQHITPALSAARDVVMPDTAQHSDEIAAFAAQLRAEQQAAPENVTRLRAEETPRQRFRRARTIEAAIARNEFVDADELIWLGGYREGPEYRAHVLTYGEASAETN